MPDFKDARIIDAAKDGSTISGIAHQTGISFPTVRRTVYAFDNIGVVKATKRRNRVFVRIINLDHPVVNSMIQSAKWINSVIWDPDTFVANMFTKNRIEYAFVGTSRIKYTKNESRNMVQIAVMKKHYEKAKNIIQHGFGDMGIKITEDPSETIGNAMSVIYIKCFPVDDIKYQTFDSHPSHSDGTVTVKVADEITDKKIMDVISEHDKMFIPYPMYS